MAPSSRAGETVKHAAELAVVVLSYRNDDTILAAVDSLLAQGVPLELVVSHSGGGDTPELLARRRPQVRVLPSEARRLPGAARNAGVTATAAPYVAFLAADCVACPGWAAGRLARHRQGAAAVASSLLPLSRRPAAIASYLLQHSYRMPHAEPASFQLEGASYARAVLERHGPFSEELELGEDTALNARLVLAGVDIAWVPEVVTANSYPTSMLALLKDQLRRGRLRGSLTAELPWRVLSILQIFAEAGVALVRSARPRSGIGTVELALAAPVALAGALAAAIGTVMRGPPPSPAALESVNLRRRLRLERLRHRITGGEGLHSPLRAGRRPRGR